MRSKSSKSCVVAGHLCLDIIPELNTAGDFASVFLPGRLLEAGPVLLSTGGAVSNTGQALHKLGVDTRLMGKIGDDIFGQAILNIIKGLSNHLTEGMLITPEDASSYTIILSPPNTDRIFFHCPGANNTFNANDVDYNLLAQVNLFHFGYPPIMRLMFENNGTELIDIFNRAKATGVTTSLDMAMPDPTSPAGQANWPKILGATLPHVDLFVPSIEEILMTLYPDIMQQVNNGTATITPEMLSTISADLLAMGPKIVLLKAGEMGLYLRTADEEKLATLGRARPTNAARWANRELWAPIFETNTVGTTGAGDSAIAGFLAALLHDMPPSESLTMAAAVGACNVEAHDAVSGIRSWEETLARVEAGWPRRTLSLNSPGWTFDEVKQVWVGPNNN